MSRIVPKIFPDAETLGVSFATRLLAQIDAARMAGQRFLLGCPGGRSPRPVYLAMGRLLAEKPRSLAHVTIVMMDDYLDKTEQGFAHVSIESHFSCRRFARDEIIAVLNAGLAQADRIPWDQVWFPDPGKPEAYDARIESAGGIDVFILASGASDGHIAFNPAGSARDSGSRIVPLAEETRVDNMKTFPDFRSLDEVPSFGVTVGIDTIFKHSRAAVMIVWGQGKRQAFSRLAAAQGYESDWPATIVAECRHGEILADEEAAGT
ncbi:MAG: 6-phosphogluconolactonase [Mesorhizobium sp.]|nr:6-phosphogluconolactonase [Mesorhizobium sp.]MBL8579484.1 6-phosphogluconolactonase [Mesorhizobium sp.]